MADEQTQPSNGKTDTIKTEPPPEAAIRALALPRPDRASPVIAPIDATGAVAPDGLRSRKVIWA